MDEAIRQLRETARWAQHTGQKEFILSVRADVLMELFHRIDEAKPSAKLLSSEEMLL